MLFLYKRSIQLNELIHVLSTPVNLFLTGLLVLCLFYWILVIVGGIGIDSVDLDFDVDADADLDIDIDADGDAEIVSGSSGILSILQFFNFGRLPMMLIFSILFLSMWLIAIISSTFFPANSTLLSLVLIIPNFVVSLFITKFLTLPIVKPYYEMTRTATDIDYIGRSCKITLPNTATKAGEAELFVDGISLNITIRGLNNQVFSKGENAIIVDQIEDKQIFYLDRINT